MVDRTPFITALALANIGSISAVWNGVIDHAAVDHACLVDPEEIFNALAGVSLEPIGVLDRVTAHHATQRTLRPPVAALA